MIQTDALTGISSVCGPHSLICPFL